MPPYCLVIVYFVFTELCDTDSMFLSAVVASNHYLSVSVTSTELFSHRCVIYKVRGIIDFISICYVIYKYNIAQHETFCLHFKKGGKKINIPSLCYMSKSTNSPSS